MYDRPEAENFKGEVDQWIKSFRRDIDLFSNDVEDLNDEFSKQREEHLLFYENLDRMERKVDRLQTSFDRILSAIDSPAKQPLAQVDPLKERV